MTRGRGGSRSGRSRRCRAIRWSASCAGSSAIRTAAAHREHPARHHGRDQRRARAQGRRRRLRDDQGLPRRALHPARQPQVPLRHELGQAEAAGQAPALLRADERIDAYGARAHAPLDEAEVRDGGGRDPRRRRRSQAVAVCLLFSYLNPAHELAGEGDPDRGAAGPAALDLLRGPAEVEGVRARLDHDRRRLSQAGREPAAARHARAARRGRHRGADGDHQVERRRDDARRRRRGADQHAASPARPAA